jgi:Family of unknown function (DUF6084)
MVVSPHAAVPQLAFAVERAAPERYAVTPTLRLTLAIASADRRPVHTLALDVQVRIAARRRRYEPAEEQRLTEVFGPVDGWKSSLSTFLWTHATVFVPSFTGATEVDMPIACTYDFEVVASKYLDALRGGVVPLELLFSGTMFYAADGGAQRIARLPLDREASFELPIAVWREALEACFPGSAWLRLRRDSFDRLAAYRARHALPTWEATVASMLEGAS